MLHTTHTHVLFADSADDAREQFLALGVKPDEDPNAKLDICKCTEDPDFDFDSPFNLIGEISLSPEYMEKINTDPQRAYVLSYIEDSEA